MDRPGASLRMAGIAIRKWYLDAVTDDGRIWIAYWASLSLGPVSVVAASVLESAPGHPPRTRTRVGAIPEPRQVAGIVEWEHAALGLAGRWESECPGIERHLITPDKRDAGSVLWRCLMPRARVSLEVGGATIGAVGYVEVIEMSVAPWNLPIRELRWGRAAAHGEGSPGSVVWIDWRGRSPRTDIFVDGLPVEGRVGDDGVGGEGFSLRVSRDRTLREGALGTAALAGVPGVSSWAPARFLGATERKWAGRAAFEGAGGRWSGWAVHEVVEFPEPGA